MSEYPIYVEPGILARLPALAREHLPGRRTVLVSDATVAALYRGYLDGSNRAWRMHERSCSDDEPAGWAPLEFPAGERSKTRETWQALTDALLADGYGRDAGIMALGGGVTGDLAGFVAATYLRGVPFIQVPTTLLAMLDSSIGGKVGVDTVHGKNLVGAFHAPVAVVADPLTLLTLDDREFRAGLAEAVKHGLIADDGHLAWIEANAASIARRDIERLAMLIRGSIAIKAAIVAADERETGRRAVLNAGHTVAHALEHASGYAIRHGEAVALGLIAECTLGEALGATEPGTRARLEGVFSRLGLPTRLDSTVSPDAVLSAMRQDKKTRAGAPGFVFAAAAGRMRQFDGAWITGADAGAVRAALATIGIA